MNFIRKIFSCIFSHDNKDEEISILKDKVNEMIDLNYKLQSQVKQLLGQITFRNEVISRLQSKLNSINYWQKDIPSEVPHWLNNNGGSYKGVRQINEKGQVVTVKIKPEDLYFPRPSLIKLATQKNWLNMDLDQKLKSIWNYVIYRIRYRYDANEDWQEPNTTNDLGYGDCEDGTILFVTLCRIAGVPADGVFNALGWFYTNTDKFGHSFPIAKMSDGKWYIFESTLDSMPPSPRLFKGSNYSADWGVQNWKYDGTIIPTSSWNNKEVKQI